MEIRMIDNQPFVVSTHGKKESILSPAEARQTEQREIEEGRAHIEQLDKAAATVRQRLESELIEGIDTSATRADLAAIEDEIHGIQREVDAAGQRFKNIDVMLDSHAAAAIQKAADARLAALIAPFNSALKELTQ
jgi:hypothetical protein